MRQILFLLWLIVLSGCKNGVVLPDQDSTSLPVKNRSDWHTESLNEDYTIQFPASYEGNGMVGFEGPTFSKGEPGKQVSFSYSFCGPLMCSSYGSAILVPYPSIPYPTSVTFENTYLDRTVAFKYNDQLQAVFYFTSQGKGLLYLKNPKRGLLMQSLNVTYPYDLHSEVLGILQSIQPH